MIELLNNNTGVIAAIQTLLTITVTSILAMMPYKKKLTIYSGLDCDNHNNCSLELNLYNAGNVPLYIKNIQIQKKYKNGNIDPLCYTYWTEKDEMERNFLVPRTMQKFILETFSCTEEDKSKTNMLIVVTTEEKIFKKEIDWSVG